MDSPQQNRTRTVTAVLVGLGMMLLVSMMVVKIAPPAALRGAASAAAKEQHEFSGFVGVPQAGLLPRGWKKAVSERPPAVSPDSLETRVAPFMQMRAQGPTAAQESAQMNDLSVFNYASSAARGAAMPEYDQLAKVTILRRGGVGGLTFFIADEIARLTSESSIGQLHLAREGAPIEEASAEQKAMVWNEVNHLMQDTYTLAKEMLALNHKALQAFGQALLNQQTVSADQFAHIMRDNGVAVPNRDFNVLGQIKLLATDLSKSAESTALKVASVGAALMLTASPAFAGDADAGEKIFNANCAACHAGGQNSVVADHTLEKAAIEKFLTGGFNEAAVVKQVTNGKNAMPAFGGRLSDDDIGNVATYVISTSEAGWD